MKLAHNAQNTKQLNIILAVLVLIAVACVGQKEAAKPSAADLVIKEVYTQKQIPGTPGRKPEVFLFVVVGSSDETIQLDSVFYNTKMYALRRSGHYSKTKIEENEHKQSKDPNNQPLLYYTKNKRSYYSIIDKVERRDPVFLP